MRAAKQGVRAWLISRAPVAYWNYRRFRRGDEEPELRLLACLCSGGGTLIDVGANFGMYTARLVGLGKRCVAFEPIPRFAKMLGSGFGERLEVEAAALSDVSGGVVTLRLPHLYTGYATIETRNGLSTRKGDRIDEVEVPRRTLDSYEYQDVSFIKVDVEGHEEHVLRGAESTLKNCRPNLVVEVEDRHNPGVVDRLTEYLSGLDFSLYVVLDAKLVSLSGFDLAKHQQEVSAELYARNVIAIPKEQQDSLQPKLERAAAAAD